MSTEPLSDLLQFVLTDLEVPGVALRFYNREGFIKTWAKKVKKAKGNYTECRGGDNWRSVFIPLPHIVHGNVTLVSELIRWALVRDFGQPKPIKVVFAHGPFIHGDWASWVVVHDVHADFREALSKLKAAYLQAVERGYTKMPAELKLEREQARVAEQARAELERQYQRGERYRPDPVVEEEVRKVLFGHAEKGEPT